MSHGARLRNDRLDQSTVPTVLVMMATCNGADFLAEQIDSIFEQRGVEVTLWVRDDLSQDATLSVLSRYASKYPSRIAFRQNSERLGVGMNFMQMVYEAKPGEFDYYAFSDQDDVWLPDKLQTAIKTIQKCEADQRSKRIEGIGTPVLYCSDLMDVDVNLEHPKHELSNLPPVESFRGSLLVRNIYSGCTMVFNGSLLVLAQKYKMDSFYRNHDAWMALLAFYCGNLIADCENALILRRISGSNTVGAISPGVDIRNASLSRAFSSSRRLVSYVGKQLLSYSSFMSKEDRELIESFAAYVNSLGGRIRWAFSNRYRSLSPLDTLLARVKFLFGRY